MLPSQADRSSNSRSHMYRRGKKRTVPIVIALAVVFLGGGTLYKWKSGSGTPAGASTPATESSDKGSAAGSTLTSSHTPVVAKNTPPAATPVTPTPRPEVKPPANPANQVQMGAPLAGTSAPPALDAAQKPANPPANPPATTPRLTTPPPQTPLSPPRTGGADSSKTAAQRLQLGLDQIAQNKPLEARRTLTAAIVSKELSAADADRARTELAKVNQKLVFGADIVAGDPFVRSYTIESGDVLARLPKKLKLDVDYRFLQRINNISSPERVQVGQRIKVITGPFSAVITKADYRLDLYMGTGADRVFVRSFKVGLGADNATPEGEYIVKPNSKLVDPAWTNPRTGEHFESKDPKNPLGHFWIGLIGNSDNIRGLESYGIHGTIEPDSIGQMKSMGCIRMADEDIKLMYEVMIDTVSHVEVHGEDYP